MALELQTLAIDPGDIVAVRTQNPHAEEAAAAISRITGAHLIVLRPEDEIEKVDAATMRRAGWVPPSAVVDTSTSGAEILRLADELVARDETIAAQNETMSRASEVIDSLKAEVVAANEKAAQTDANGSANSSAIDTLNARVAELEAENAQLKQAASEASAAAAPVTESAPVDKVPAPEANNTATP